MQAIDMPNLLNEGFSQGALGVGISIGIAWLRSKHWFNNAWTLPLSYTIAALTTIGVHFIFEGDFITGSTLIIKIPDAHHILESMVSFASNITGQKGYTMMNQQTEVLKILSKLALGPTLTTVQPVGRSGAVLSESQTTAAAEAKPGV